VIRSLEEALIVHRAHGCDAAKQFVPKIRDSRRGISARSRVAFLVGYREATFRELVKRLGDVVLKPGDSTQPAITAVTPPSGPTKGGQTVAITGTGLAQLVALRIGATQASPTDLSDTHIIFTTPPAAKGVVPITVDTGDGTLAAQYEYQ
jgi:IPT/TIG domain